MFCFFFHDFSKVCPEHHLLEVANLIYVFHIGLCQHFCLRHFGLEYILNVSTRIFFFFFYD